MRPAIPVGDVRVRQTGKLHDPAYHEAVVALREVRPELTEREAIEAASSLLKAWSASNYQISATRWAKVFCKLNGGTGDGVALS